jgi:hypothetical protein
MICSKGFFYKLQCSIDSLLERTIKHMLFLESITKHADKLGKCAEPKVGQTCSLQGNCFCIRALSPGQRPSYVYSWKF